MRLLLAAAILGFGVHLVRANQNTPEIRLVRATADEAAAIEVVGVNPTTLAKLRIAKLESRDWHNLLTIVVAEGTPADIASRPPVAGTYSVTDKTIRFEPQFKLTPGLKYRATFNPSQLPDGDLKASPVVAELSIPKPPPGPPTSIIAVFPSANVLPENAIRFYVHFSGPMSRGDIYRHFKLIRDDGRVVESPFLELDEELWAIDDNRITIFFHPGRVKRGLEPRETVGPILEAGHTYTLVIDRKWEDAEGKPLVTEYRKTFRVGPPDDQPIDPMQWTLIAPRAGSDSPLIVRLAKPLDRALLESHLWINDAAGHRVPMRVSVGGGERVVAFAPVGPWQPGHYSLAIDTRLEDVCGNRVDKPFEVDVFHPIQRKIETKLVTRRFTVR